MVLNRMQQVLKQDPTAMDADEKGVWLRATHGNFSSPEGGSGSPREAATLPLSLPGDVMRAPLPPTALLVAALALSPTAQAEDAAKPAPQMLPKPAPPLVDAFKGMTGTWACKGTFPKKDGSGTLTSTSTMVVTSTADGFVYLGEVVVAKSPQFPTDIRQQFSWAYNPLTKKLVEFFGDSFGGVGQGTSDGLVGDTVVWDEDAVKMNTAVKSRTSVKHIGPTEVALTFDFQLDGKWSTAGTKSCKKQ